MHRRKAEALRSYESRSDDEDISNNEEDDKNKIKEDYPKIIYKLCYLRRDGNTEVKEHVIKGHIKDING